MIFGAGDHTRTYATVLPKSSFCSGKPIIAWRRGANSLGIEEHIELIPLRIRAHSSECFLTPVAWFLYPLQVQKIKGFCKKRSQVQQKVESGIGKKRSQVQAKSGVK